MVVGLDTEYDMGDFFGLILWVQLVKPDIGFPSPFDYFLKFVLSLY